MRCKGIERPIGVQRHRQRVELVLVLDRRDDVAAGEAVKDEGGDPGLVQDVRPHVQSGPDPARPMDQDHRRNPAADAKGQAQLAAEQHVRSGLVATQERG